MLLQVNISGRCEWNWSQIDPTLLKKFARSGLSPGMKHALVVRHYGRLMGSNCSFYCPQVVAQPLDRRHSVSVCAAAGLRGNRRESGKHGCTPQKDHQHCRSPGGHRSIQVRWLHTHTHRNKSRSIYSDTWLAEVGAFNEWVNTVQCVW